MKKLFALFIAVVAIAQSSLHAASFFVSNNPSHGATYTTVASAISAASAGDSIFVAGSNTSYGQVNVNKAVKLYGPGYFRDGELEAHISYFEIGNGAEVYGFYVSDLRPLGSNIIISRCRIVGRIEFYQSNIHTILIEQCHIYTTSTLSERVQVDYCENVVFRNNLIFCGTNTTGIDSIYVFTTASNVRFVNNVIRGGIRAANTTFENNIWIGQNASAEDFTWVSNGNNVWTNNILTGNQAVGGEGNLAGQPLAIVFSGSATGNGGANYAINTGGPAVEFGTDGKDAGMFGGGVPYVLNGLPPVPVITSSNIPTYATPSSGLPVEATIEINE